MRKKLILTSAMAASLTALSGCSSNDEWNEDLVADNDTAICVDDQGMRIDDDACDNDGSGYYGGYYGKKYKKYYLNRGSKVPYYGDSVRDTRHKFSGGYAAKPGATYAAAPSASKVTRSQAVSRGGMGSSSRSYGGGRS